jgi:hypothetical protein
MRVRADRAMGQLKAASAISGQAAGLNDEASRTLATNAFEGKQAEGGQAPASPIGLSNPDAPTTVTPLGQGAPGAPEVTQHTNATDYQNDLNQAYNLGAQAGDMKKQSMIMMILGFIMIAAGVALLFYPMTAVGLAMIVAGSGMVGMAMMLQQQAQKTGAQAKQIGQAIHRQYGQEAQGKIVDTCMDQAITNGTRPENCQYDNDVPQSNGAAGAAAIKEGEATYTIDDENGAPAKAEGTAGPAPEHVNTFKPMNADGSWNTAPDGAAPAAPPPAHFNIFRPRNADGTLNTAPDGAAPATPPPAPASSPQPEPQAPAPR